MSHACVVRLTGTRTGSGGEILCSTSNHKVKHSPKARRRLVDYGASKHTRAPSRRSWLLPDLRNGGFSKVKNRYNDRPSHPPAQTTGGHVNRVIRATCPHSARPIFSRCDRQLARQCVTLLVIILPSFGQWVQRYLSDGLSNLLAAGMTSVILRDESISSTNSLNLRHQRRPLSLKTY